MFNHSKQRKTKTKTLGLKTEMQNRQVFAQQKAQIHQYDPGYLATNGIY